MSPLPYVVAGFAILSDREAGFSRGSSGVCHEPKCTGIARNAKRGASGRRLCSTPRAISSPVFPSGFLSIGMQWLERRPAYGWSSAKDNDCDGDHDDQSKKRKRKETAGRVLLHASTCGCWFLTDLLVE